MAWLLFYDVSFTTNTNFHLFWVSVVNFAEILTDLEKSLLAILKI